jgi:hypothetical protein
VVACARSLSNTDFLLSFEGFTVDEVVIVQIKISKKVRERVALRVSQCKCVKPECNDKSVKRGLCQRHYDQWIAARRMISGKMAKARFDADLIQIGELMGAYEVREYRSNSYAARARRSAS